MRMFKTTTEAARNKGFAITNRVLAGTNVKASIATIIMAPVLEPEKYDIKAPMITIMRFKVILSVANEHKTRKQTMRVGYYELISD